ncbi:MAG: ATP synthase F0 subunit B [Desulfovibrionaceae bacterium]|nr:ATP synthase F0 subunit B [Desulfovibrionaceae bacterium]
MLDLNITLLFQLVNFFIALYVLNLLLIRPIRAIMRERKAKMDGMAGEADGFEAEASSRLKNYQAQLAQARQEAGQNRDAGNEAGAAEQQIIVGAAQKQAQQILAEAQAAVRAEADATLTALRGKVQDLAGKVATKIVA